MDHNTALMLAARNGCIEKTRDELENASAYYINQQNDVGNTALMAASMYGHVECMGLLLNTQLVDVNIQDNENNTALMLAASHGHSRCVSCLLDPRLINVNNINIQNTRGRTAFMIAAAYGHTECLRRLLSTGLVDVNIQNKNGNTAFTLAARYGHTECVRCLFNSGLININHQNKEGNTALMLASWSSHNECVRYLLHDTRLVDIGIQNKAGKTALESAIGYGQTEFIKLLFDSGQVDVNLLEKNTRAAHMGDSDIEWARRLCEESYSSNENLSQMQHKFLMLATMNGHTECVKYILSRDENLMDTKDYEGRTLLMIAAMNGRVDCVQYFLANDRLVLEYDRFGNTAFMLAAMNGHTACLRSFFDIRESHVEASDEVNQTQTLVNFTSVFVPEYSDVYIRYLPGIMWRRPYICDRRQKKTSVLKLRLWNGRVGCSVCFFTKGFSVTHYSQECPFSQINNIDLSQSDDICNGFDYEGNTALMYSAMNGDYESAKYLIQFERIRCDILVRIFHELIQHFHSDATDKWLNYFIHDKRQVNGLLRIMKNGRHPGICIDYLLSVFVCHCNYDGRSALSSAVYNENQGCIGLLVEHVSDYHKKCNQMLNLFLNGAKYLRGMKYLPIFLRAEIFDWSWYSYFPRMKMRFLARELVINGYTPNQFDFQGKVSSPLHHAFMIGDIGLIRYLLANVYMTSHDLQYFQRGTELRHGDQLEGSEEIQQLHQELCHTPWRLEALSFLTVSTLLGSKRREKDVENMTGIPEALRLRLAFKNPMRWLCVKQWTKIGANFMLRPDPIFIDDTLFSNKECCNGACRKNREWVK